MYSILPECVARLASPRDMPEILAFAKERGLPVTPRAGGTNLTGGAVGPGMVLDVSPLNDVREVDPGMCSVSVGPGVTLSDLNVHLKRWNMHLGVDPSSGEMCRIGGMIGTNASGSHHRRYGAMRDSVLGLDVWLASGEHLILEDTPVGSPGFRRLIGHRGMERCYEIISSNIDMILERRPPVAKSSAGYDIFTVAERLTRGTFSPQMLFVGSEGTLGVVTGARLKLHPLPRRISTVRLYLRSLDALDAVVERTLALDPSAFELMDSRSMDLVGRERYDIPPEAEAMLLVEFDDDDPSGKVAGLREVCRAEGVMGTAEVAVNGGERERLWEARRSIFPTLYRYHARLRPLNFIDDIVVEPGRVGELLGYISDLCDGLGVEVALFGHVGDGGVHVTPLLDLGSERGKEVLLILHEKVHEKVIAMGGSISGEHGDGRARSAMLTRMFGREICRLFDEVKQALDPEGLFNPGIKTSAPAVDEHIGTERVMERCASCGRCEPVCPPYALSGEAHHGARGWFTLVRSGDITSAEKRALTDLCLNCKNCRWVCPAGVDVSSLILGVRRAPVLIRFLARLRNRGRVFERLVRTAAYLRPVWDTPRGRSLLETLSGLLGRTLRPGARIPAALQIPPLARRTLRERYPDHARTGVSEVAYFHGCAANLFDDGVGDAVISIVRRAGEGFDLPEQRCTGMPFMTYGERETVLENARYNIDSLTGYRTIITSCGSCNLMLKDYPSLLADDPIYRRRGERIASRVKDISEFALDRFPEVRAVRPHPPVTYHASCHLRTAGVDAPKLLLSRMFGDAFRPMEYEATCAGGGGTYILKDIEMSDRIFERKARSIVRSGAGEVVTGCPACMVRLGTGMPGGVRVRHIARVIDDVLRG